MDCCTQDTHLDVKDTDSNSKESTEMSSAWCLEESMDTPGESGCQGDDVDSYYFESDHLAFQGNRDYSMMLKTIALLEAQRVQAIRDLDTLHEGLDKALEDPFDFVNNLQHGVDLGLPKSQKITELPIINWDQYTSSVDFSSLGFPKHLTRLRKQLVNGTGSEEHLQENIKEEGPVEVVRGRVKNENKPATFNKLWTAEEQKRLEELLIEFPPEEVEAKRWTKIANALGNRTPIQVASRVQKYFIKLAKAGLPIPGRLPNVALQRQKAAHRHHRFHKFYTQPSTFLTSHEPPVYMSDEESTNDTFYYGNDAKESYINSFHDFSDDEIDDEDDDFPDELRNTPEYRELKQLKLVKQNLTKIKCEETFKHFGFKCDSCDCDPIIGIRWHCQDCNQDDSVDFCNKCADGNVEIGQHNSSHRLVAVSQESNDRDYNVNSFMPFGYNYLDPNYMPAN